MSSQEDEETRSPKSAPAPISSENSQTENNNNNNNKNQKNDSNMPNNLDDISTDQESQGSEKKHSNSEGEESQASQRAKTRERAIQELLETEEIYVADLKILIFNFILRIRNMKDKNFHELIKRDPDISLAFQTVEFIMKDNQTFFQQLKEKPGRIGEVFCKNLESTLSYYGIYCNYQEKVIRALKRMEENNKMFHSFLEEVKMDPKVKQLGIDSYLSKPFQRLTKYPLLLETISKNTPDEHEDKPFLKKASEQLKMLVDKINQDKKQSDDQKTVIELSKNILNIPSHFNILTPSRKYIFDGILQKISGNHDQERYFVLFNDCLLYCAKKSPDQYEFKDVIYLKDLELIDIPDDEISWKITRRDERKKGLTYKLYGKTAPEKQRWIKAINSQLEQINELSKFTAPKDSKSIVRVYFSHKDKSDAFKAVAITMSMTASELLSEVKKKLQVDNIENIASLELFVSKNSSLRRVGSTENVSQIIKREGRNFGSSFNHTFKLFSEDSTIKIAVTHSTASTVELEIPLISFYQIARELEDHVQLIDRKGLLKTHVRCFVAKEAVDWLMRSVVAKQYILTRDDAIAFGQKLCDLNLIHHVERKPRFEDKEGAFFKFSHQGHSDKDPPSLSQMPFTKSFDLSEKPPPLGERLRSFSQSMEKSGLTMSAPPSTTTSSTPKDIQSSLTEVAFHLQKSVVIKDRYYHLKKFKSCFISQEAIDWMISCEILPRIQSRSQAIQLGQELIDAKIIEHVPNPLKFQDGYFFYKCVLGQETSSKKSNTK